MAIYNQSYNQPYQNNFQTYSQNQGFNTGVNFNTSQAIDTGIIWVQGESGAKAYPVYPGKSVVLFDSETEHFFIKSVDASGMPQPLRIFSYSEASENDVKPLEIDTSMFITREEFEQAISQLKQKPTQHINQSKGGNRNGKSLIQSNEQYNKPLQ